MVTAELRGVVADVVGEVDGFDLALEQGKMSPDASRAFTVWLGMQDRRLDLAGVHTGHSADVVRQWSVRYGWRDLARRYDLAVSTGLMVQLRSTLIVEGFKSIQRAIEVRDSEIDGKLIRAGDVLKAAFWLASLTGIGSQLAADDGVTGGGISAADLRRMATSGNPDDLRKLVELTTGRGENP